MFCHLSILRSINLSSTSSMYHLAFAAIRYLKFIEYLSKYFYTINYKTHSLQTQWEYINHEFILKLFYPDHFLYYIIID